MEIVRYATGSLAICGEFPSKEVIQAIESEVIDQYGLFPLTFTDPPYGGIIDEEWDDIPPTEMARLLIQWSDEISYLTLEGGALYLFGGIGTQKNRPFFNFLSNVETLTDWQLSTLITWKKKRAYGVQWGYLFTREEIAYLVNGDFKKPRMFKIPLLDKLRGYEGYDKAHPAKSEYLRRTNVWDDVTEILRGKIVKAEKPVALAKIAIEAHTVPGEFVFDPFAGSGSTGVAAKELGRRFVLIEKDPETFRLMVDNLEGIRKCQKNSNRSPKSTDSAEK